MGGFARGHPPSIVEMEVCSLLCLFCFNLHQGFLFCWCSSLPSVHSLLLILRTLCGDPVHSHRAIPHDPSLQNRQNNSNPPSPHPHFLQRTLKATDTNPFLPYPQLSAWRHHHPSLDQARNLSSSFQGPTSLIPQSVPHRPPTSPPSPNATPELCLPTHLSSFQP